MIKISIVLFPVRPHGE